jgi:hypothetical protein
MSTSGESVFKTNNLEIFQDTRLGRVILDCYGEEIDFRLCEFFAFKRRLLNVDIVTLLTTDGPDSHVFYLAHCDRFLLLTLHQILEIRELVTGARVMLELNNLIHERLIRRY